MKVIGLQTFIWSNNIRSLFLLLLFPIILSVVIFLIIFAFSAVEYNTIETALDNSVELLFLFFWHIVGAAALWFIVAWMFHRQMILGMTKAKPLERKDNKRVYDIVERLAISRGVPTPKLYIIEDQSLNAFASGLSPKNAMIAFSKGILSSLNDQELEAVAAHELTHILNRDIRLMVISIIFVGIIQTLSEFFLRIHISGGKNNKGGGNAVLILLAIKLVVFMIGFLFTVLVQLAISRKREYLADAGAVELTKTGAHLITALEKISKDSRIEVIENRSAAQMCIENPLEKKLHSHKKSSFMERIFSTHPPIPDRISALQNIG